MGNATLVGLSRQMALQRELEVVANNIANLNTNGFKADGAIFAEYVMPVARDNLFRGADTRVSFVHDRATWRDFSQGSVSTTNNPLDIAIQGNGYLVVQTPRGERYTRNGALQISSAGQLVTSEGFPVLGDNGPIQFQTTDHSIVINAEGVIRVQEGVNSETDTGRGKLRLVAFADQQQLQKDGTSLFTAPNQQPQPATEVRVVQGAVEKSNVRSVVEMTRMIEVSRVYAQVAALLQQEADIHRTAIDRLAEVPV
jgi:flagellar basal-body rod protein FlgF/flagellar basal-body rod protein FlgG